MSTRQLFSGDKKSQHPPLPELPPKVRILPYSDGVLFPNMLLPMGIYAKHLMKLVEESVSSDRVIAVFAMKEVPAPENEKNPDLYQIGS